MPPKRAKKKTGAGWANDVANWKPPIGVYTHHRKQSPIGFRVGGRFVPMSKVKQYGGAHQTGNGWFSDLIGKVYKGATSVYNVGKKVYDTGKKVYDKLQDSKIISKVASAIPHPAAQKIAASASQYGFGRQRGGRMTKGNAVLLL